MHTRRFFSPDIPPEVPIDPNPRPDLVFVQGGEFSMGSNDWAGTRPIHTVKITSFYMSTAPITQEQWRDLMGTQLSNWQEPHSPAAMVNWYDAVEYCNQRSLKEELTPCYKGRLDAIICDWSANGYRLPTEAEWEYAARGAVDPPDYLYSGSDDINAVAWYSANSGISSHPVGSKAPNELETYDMSGNLIEWCWDWYGSYSSTPQTNPTGPASGPYRVLRGGSWIASANNSRVAMRHYLLPWDRDLDIGFRVCRRQ